MCYICFFLCLLFPDDIIGSDPTNPERENEGTNLTRRAGGNGMEWNGRTDFYPPSPFPPTKKIFGNLSTFGKRCLSLIKVVLVCFFRPSTPSLIVVTLRASSIVSSRELSIKRNM